MSDLARLIREARLDDPDSMRRLALALAREGYDDGAIKQFELTWWTPSGVVLRSGVVFEGGRGGVAFRARVRESLGYHLALRPVEAWAEAEIAITESGALLLRHKTFWLRRAIHNEAELVKDLAAASALARRLRDDAQRASPDDSNRLELTVEAIEGALAWCRPS